MELIRISDSKLKVMLSADDMREYEFDDINTIHTKEAFRNLMREAKNRCGFNALEGRVFVQLYRSRSGGCELFVTKLPKAEHENIPAPCESEERMHTEYRRYYEKQESVNRQVIYGFDEMRNLLSVCEVLLASRYSGTSTAYAEKGRHAFYLALDEETFAAGEHFGTLCPSSFCYYINEHCDLFCENAVPILGKLA